MRTTLHTTLNPEKHSFTILAPEAARVVATTGQPRSPWHSPVPYLFGGLAAMLGLIAFALLILACSYWRLSRDDTQQQQSNEGRDLESGEKGDGVSHKNGAPIFEEKIVVIMAGNDKPTFLATPALMPFSNNINSTNNDHDHLKIIGTSTSNDPKVDGDDEKPKEDENTQSHN